MYTIHPDRLTIVVGAVAPAASTNNLADWLPKNTSDIKSPDMTAYSNPPSPNFRTTTPMVESGPDRSWEKGLPNVFDHFGIR